LPKTRLRRGCNLNPGPSTPESSTLTTRLPSHPRVRSGGRCPPGGDKWPTFGLVGQGTMGTEGGRTGARRGLRHGTPLCQQQQQQQQPCCESFITKMPLPPQPARPRHGAAVARQPRAPPRFRAIGRRLGSPRENRPRSAVDFNRSTDPSNVRRRQYSSMSTNAL